MILILGGNSQLGCYLNLNIKKSVLISKTECDITKISDIKKLFKKYNPKFIFNCAAYTNTVLAEKEIRKVFNINSFPLRDLVKLSNQYNCKFIHFSTDYVFDGSKNKPYIESDSVNPINIYGQSKLMGELIVQNYCKKYLIIRLSSLYGHPLAGINNHNSFISKIIALSKSKKKIYVNDIRISPTYIGDAAMQINKIFKKVNNEIVHCSSLGSTTWYKFAKYVFDSKKILKKIYKSEVYDNKKIKRPLFSVLKNQYLIKKNINIMPDWKVGYKNFIKDLNLKKTTHLH